MCVCICRHVGKKKRIFVDFLVLLSELKVKNVERMDRFQDIIILIIGV